MAGNYGAESIGLKYSPGFIGQCFSYSLVPILILQSSIIVNEQIFLLGNPKRSGRLPVLGLIRIAVAVNDQSFQSLSGVLVCHILISVLEKDGPDFRIQCQIRKRSFQQWPVVFERKKFSPSYAKGICSDVRPAESVEVQPHKYQRL